MQNKRIVVILIAMSMMLALAACGNTFSRSRVAGSDGFQAPLRDIEKFVSDPSAESAMQVIGGDYIGKELTDFLTASLELTDGQITGIEQDVLQMLDMDGVKTVEIRIKNKTDMSEKDMDAYQKALDGMAESFVERRGEVTDLDVEYIRDKTGKGEKEARELSEDFQEAVNALANKLEGSTIEKACDLELEMITGDEVREGHIKVFCINGEWVSEALFSVGI